MSIVCNILLLYMLILFAGALLSWFPAEYGSGLYQVREAIGRLTEPVVGPVRRAVGATFGGIDFSVMIVMFGIIILRGILCD